MNSEYHRKRAEALEALYDRLFQSSQHLDAASAHVGVLADLERQQITDPQPEPTDPDGPDGPDGPPTDDPPTDNRGYVLKHDEPPHVWPHSGPLESFRLEQTFIPGPMGVQNLLCRLGYDKDTANNDADNRGGHTIIRVKAANGGNVVRLVSELDGTKKSRLVIRVVRDVLTSGREIFMSVVYAGGSLTLLMAANGWQRHFVDLAIPVGDFEVKERLVHQWAFKGLDENHQSNEGMRILSCKVWINEAERVLV